MKINEKFVHKNTSREELITKMTEIIDLTDELVTAVISGQPDLMNRALRVARELDILKRQGVIKE